jgi:hypothetical protein
VGTKRALDPLFAMSRIPTNSDYFPVVDQHAAKARFLKQQSMELGELGRDFVPIVRLIDGEARLTPAQLGQTSGVASPAVEQGIAARRRVALLLGESGGGSLPPDAQGWKFAGAQSALSDCRRMSGAWVDVVAEALRSSAALLPLADLKRFADAVRASKCTGALGPRERLRLDFYLAAGEANHAATAQAGSALLERPEGIAQEEAAGVIAGTMAALLASGQPAAALEVWQSHRAKAPSGRLPMALLLTVSHAIRAANSGAR